jgi:hypothetical protein
VIRPCILVVSTLIVICRSTFAAPEFEFRGDWRIDRIVGTADITTDEKYQRRLIGKRIHIGRDSITIGSYSCTTHRVIPAADIPTEDLLFFYYRAHPERTGVPKRTDVLAMDLCNDVFRHGDRIIVEQDGAFYEASRVKR